MVCTFLALEWYYGNFASNLGTPGIHAPFYCTLQDKHACAAATLESSC